jgi:hypothetical protein
VPAEAGVSTEPNVISFSEELSSIAAKRLAGLGDVALQITRLVISQHLATGMTSNALITI